MGGKMMTIRDFIIKTATEQQVNPIDVTAGGTGVLVWLQWAPDLAGAFTVLWLGIRIYVALRDEVFGDKKEKKDGDE
jgi:hypothetical protein